MYCRSSVKQSRLKQIYSVLEKKSIKIKAIHEVRWLSRADAVLTILRCRDVLEIYFSDAAQDDPGAAGISKLLSDIRYVYPHTREILSACKF